VDTNLAQMIAVMSAALQGAEIECLCKSDPYDEWRTIIEPKWNWKNFDYRVKIDDKPDSSNLFEISYKN